MNKDKFEDYNQKGSINESLDIKKEENYSPFSDTFVYKKEENKITWTNDAAPQGKEVNSNETLINKPEQKEEQLDQKDIEKVTNATAKVGTAVTTTAAVVTTAVVAIVGVDLVTTELVNELPQICQISEVISTSETISFVLNVGDDEREAYSSEQGKECNLIVELTCEKYDDVQEISVLNYGALSAQFTNLREETDYSINVYQPSFLYLERRYILEEPITASTERGTRNNISLEVEVDPLGNDVYYSTITYKDTLGINLYNYCLNVYNDDSAQNGEMMAWANLDSTDPFAKQRLYWSSFSGIDAEPYFVLSATTDDQEYISTHQDDNTSGRPQDEMDINLFSQRINIEYLERPGMTISKNQIFANRVWSEESSSTYYTLYFATPYEEGTYDELILSITDTSGESTVAASMRTPGTTPSMNTSIDYDLEFGTVGEYEQLKFTLSGLSHRQEDVDAWNNEHPNPASGPATVDGGAETTICEQIIDFGTINTNVVQYEPVVNNVSFLEIATYENPSRLGIIMEKTDPGYHLQSYSILINDYEYNIVADDYTDDYLIIEGAENLIGSTDVMNYVLYGMSDYGMSYNRTQKVELFESEDDFSDMSPTYIQGCADLRYINGGDQYYLSFTIYYEGSTSYDYFILYICDLDGNVITEEQGADIVEYRFTQTAGESDVTTTVPTLQGNYIVKTCGYQYYEVTLYSEIIDFGNIELSV